MDCPDCKNASLSPVQLEEGLIAAGCNRCSGALLSLINYRFWAENNLSINNVDDDVEIKESSGAKLCPKCRKLMTKYQIGLGTDNRIDLCGHCDEAWLDKGEWALLKQLDVHDKLPELFTDAWQTNIRKTRQQEHWRAYFEKLIGKDDFAQVEQFKLWLDDHKKIDEIKHYLNARLEM